MPLRKFNQLQDKYFEVSKRMREASNVQEKMTLLSELQRILKESKNVLDEIHKKQPGSHFNAAN
jgi:ubiquinone/menaquinone biosynthesis C-methylase UbiE